MLRKRLSLALSLLVISGCVIAATRYITGQPNEKSNALRIKVLRAKDHLKNKPTGREVASFKATQEQKRDERQVEDKLPRHLPIEIKIKAEKAKQFKDLNNDRWVRDLELEVKNTGNKPIYYLVVLLNLPELRVGAGNLLFDLRFGDQKFMNFAAGARPDDLSLKPGERYVFKVEGGGELDWDNFRRGKDWPKPKRFELLFQELSFGDGTGYAGTDGHPLPRKISRLTAPDLVVASQFETSSPRSLSVLCDSAVKMRANTLTAETQSTPSRRRELKLRHYRPGK